MTAVIVAVGGIVLFTATIFGCGSANTMHVKLSPSTGCVTLASTVTSPSPETALATLTTDPAASPSPVPELLTFPPFGKSASGPATPETQVDCRLPVYTGGPGSGGFITFPSGNFTPDPRSAVTAPVQSPGTASPSRLGSVQGDQGWWGTTYDRAHDQWLPVPPGWVAPDATWYAYPAQSTGINIQNVANGTAVKLGEGQAWQIVGVDATGVYAGIGASNGLWLLSLAGAVTQLTDSGSWQAIGGGFAYGTLPLTSGLDNKVIRLDLGNGATAVYWLAPSILGSVPGFDPAGNPVIYARGTDNFSIWIGTGATASYSIAWLRSPTFSPNGPLVADSHGLWVAGNDGIALHVKGVGWYAMSNLGAKLAGGCY
jgi:hypothetical protein